MIRLGTVVMSANDVERAVAFWSGVLGYEPVHFTDSENDFTILVPALQAGHTSRACERADTPPGGTSSESISTWSSTTPRSRPRRSSVWSVSGATRVEWDLYPDDPDFVVLADTEGNRFCIVDASHG